MKKLSEWHYLAIGALAVVIAVGAITFASPQADRLMITDKNCPGGVGQEVKHTISVSPASESLAGNLRICKIIKKKDP